VTVVDDDHRLGFELTGIFPIAREMDHLPIIEFASSYAAS
jgi:hypothetical protein